MAFMKRRMREVEGTVEACLGVGNVDGGAEERGRAGCEQKTQAKKQHQKQI